jgi:DNA repair exonuclease SbcCD ATPase subunit|tara:strand:+ start:392 stop:2164 length:1773 start_codon:yes stop_codon:yes gene_type:complete
MIILKTLAWSNCFSYGEGNEIDLSKATLTQLVGTNGVGKSSIPLILEEVLFNKNSKNIKKADIANRYVNKGYDISLSFSIDSNDYVIAVSRRTNLKCRLTKNGEDISSHTATNTYKTLGEVLGIDFKTFTQLVYQNTNASLQFLTATDTNRKKFLIDLLKLDDYVKYFEIFKEAVRQDSLSVSRLESKIDTIDKWLNDNKLEDTSLLSKLDLPFHSEEDEKTLRSLQIEFENISEKNKKISTNNYWKEQLKTIKVEKTTGEIQDYDDLQSQLGRWRAEANKKIFSGTDEKVCPTCLQEVDIKLIEDIQIKQEKEVESARIKVSEILSKIEGIKEQNAKIYEAQERQREFEEIYRSIDQSLPTDLLSETDLESSISTLKERIGESRAKLEEIIEENNRRERHNTKIGIIQEQTEDFEKELEEVSGQLFEKEDNLQILELLKKAFSTNGLLAYKIENMVKNLEEMTNHYLAEFSDGRFALNFVIQSDKLNVEVSDNGNIIDITALSSGELARVNIATLVAIRRLMSSISSSRINVLFLDEVNQALDEQGKEKVVEVLLKEDDLNTYLVSHGWTHPLLEKIEIIKENNISTLS